MRYILHYTDPGDIVFDGFCGTGMTGAAHLCGDKKTVESRYQVRGDKVLDAQGKPVSRLGTRKSVLQTLPAATFIAYNYNTPMDTEHLSSKPNVFSRRWKKNSAGCMRLIILMGKEGQDKLHGLE